MILALALAGCAAPATRDVTVLVGANREPLMLRDGANCAIVLPREVSYSQLGAMVRRCYEEQR